MPLIYLYSVREEHKKTNKFFMVYTKTIAEKNMPFLEKIKEQANLENIYEARDLTEIVYRTMRDLIPTETIDRVTSELETETLTKADENTTGVMADLWQDTNPLVAWLSRIRPHFQGEAPFTIDDNLFITRVEQEGGMPVQTNGETVIKAVFTATKEELSSERCQEIETFLPGKIRQMWQEA